MQTGAEKLNLAPRKINEPAQNSQSLPVCFSYISDPDLSTKENLDAIFLTKIIFLYPLGHRFFYLATS